MPDDLGDDATVLRFRPMMPEALLRSAGKEYRRAGHHGLSVFAAEARPGETTDDLIKRLLEVSERSNVDPDSNPVFFLCARAGDLRSSGFVFGKDRYPGEVAEHYCVQLGDSPGIEQATEFVKHFGDRRRRMG